MRRNGAFTTIEMIIVLGLVAAIFCIVGPQIGQSNQRLAEQRFWNSFKQEWHLAQVRAQLTHQSTSVIFDPSLDALVFISHRQRRSVDLPSTLQVRKFASIEMKPDGYVRPGTRRFYSRTDHCGYRLVIQMARGEYDVKKE